MLEFLFKSEHGKRKKKKDPYYIQRQQQQKKIKILWTLGILLFLKRFDKFTHVGMMARDSQNWLHTLFQNDQVEKY